VGHLAGIRHYEKATSNNNNKNNDKEIVSKQIKDKRNVRNFSAFVLMFLFLAVTLYIHCLLLFLSLHITHQLSHHLTQQSILTLN
jgi:pheromone shutdown protein TraB